MTWRAGSLRTRVFLVSAMLVLVPVVAALVAVTWLADRVADRSLAASLSRAQGVQSHFRDWRAGQLALAAQLVASNPAFASYVAEAVAAGAHGQAVDSLSIADQLAERRSDLGFDFALVLDPEGRILARTDRPGREQDDLSGEPLVARALEELEPVTGPWLSRGRLHQAAIVPISRQLDLIGLLVMGLAIDDALAGEISRVSGCDAAFLAPPAADGATPEVLASSLDDEQSRLLARLVGSRTELLGLFRDGGPPVERMPLELGGQRLVARLDPLVDAAGRPVVVVASLAPVDPHAAPFRLVRSVVAAAGLLSALAALVLAFFLSRRTFRPLQELTDAAAAAAAGDYSRVLRVPPDPEVGGMARAFNTLLRDLRARRQMEGYVSEIARHLPEAAMITRPHASIAGARDSSQEITVVDPTRQARQRTPQPEADGPGVGTVVGGRYEVLAVVGQGGMGVVYKAHDRELNEVVALKVLRRGLADAPRQLEQIKGEIKLARKITHPNVLRTFDYGEHEGRPYISMEYVRGMTLRYLLSRRDGLPPAPALFLLKQLCDGLAVAHAAGVIHRDIKPENIILDQQGSAKLMDFGIAAPVFRELPHLDDGVFGTPLYLAPELFQGEPGDVRADIYATGVVIFEIFTGRLPFRARDMEALYEEKSREAPAPSRVRPGMPAGLDDIVARCLHPDPSRRPPDAASLRRDLDRLEA